MKNLAFPLAYSVNTARTFVYSIEARFVQGLSRKLEPLVKAPKAFDKKVMDALKNRARKLHIEDAKNIEKGIYPFDVLIKPNFAFENIMIFPKLTLDYLKM